MTDLLDTIATPAVPLDVRGSAKDFSVALAHVLHFGADATPAVLERLGVGVAAWEEARATWFETLQKETRAGELGVAKALAKAFAPVRKELRAKSPAWRADEAPPAAAPQSPAEPEPKPPPTAASFSVLEASNAAASKAARAVPPALPLEQFASLSATLEVLPARRVSILERYGVTEETFEALRQRWEIEFEHDPPLRDRFRKKRDEVGARLVEEAAPAPAAPGVDATAELSPSDLLKLKAALPFGRAAGGGPNAGTPQRSEHPAEHPMDTGTIEAPNPLLKPATPFEKPDDDLDGTIEMQTPLRKKP